MSIEDFRISHSFWDFSIRDRIFPNRGPRRGSTRFRAGTRTSGMMSLHRVWHTIRIMIRTSTVARKQRVFENFRFAFFASELPRLTKKCSIYEKGNNRLGETARTFDRRAVEKSILLQDAISASIEIERCLVYSQRNFEGRSKSIVISLEAHF